jgi:hypothetical protein
VLKGARVILKCRMQIGLREVARVARLGEQCKVCKGQAGRQGAICRSGLFGPAGREPRVNEGAGKADEQPETCQQDPLTAWQLLQTEVHGPNRPAALR